MKDVLEIVSRMNYITPDKYLSGVIKEYDIQKANISMLRYKNIIDDDKYLYYTRMDKMSREIEIGMMIKRNQDIYQAIQTGIIEAKQQFVSENEINDSSKIVRVANDAIYIIGIPYIKTVDFCDGYVHFNQKGVYNVMMNLNGIIFFIDLTSSYPFVDIKGIREGVLGLHVDHILSIIINTVITLERAGVKDAINSLSEFIEDYVKLNLDIRYYREFNSESMYKIKNSPYKTYEVSDINDIDINYNLTLLRELFGILVNMLGTY